MPSRKLLLGFGLYLGVAASSATAQEPVLTIDDAVQRAVEQGPSARLLRSTLAVKEQNVTVARRADWPTLKTEFRALRGHGEPTSFISVNQRLDPDEPAPPDSTTTGNYGVATVELSAPLYQHGSPVFGTSAAERAAWAQRDSAQADGQSQAIQTANRTAKFYLGALAEAESETLQQDRRERLEKRVHYLRERRQAGIGSRADLLTAEAALAMTVADLRSTQRGAALQQRQVCAQLGLPGDCGLTLAPLANTLPALPPVDALAEDAMKAHPTLGAQQARLRSSEAQVGVARGEYLPKLSLEAVGVEAGNLEDSGPANFATVGLKFSMPLLAGESHARVRARQLEVQEAQETLAVARSGLVQMIYTAYNACLDAIDQHEARQASLAFAEYQEQASQAKYEKQLIDLGPLLADEAAALKARTDLVESRYQAWKAYADLVLALGLPFRSTALAAAPAP